MRARLLLAAAAALTLLACSNSATAPRGVTPASRSQDEEGVPNEDAPPPNDDGPPPANAGMEAGDPTVCRSGYIINTREGETPECEQPE